MSGAKSHQIQASFSPDSPFTRKSFAVWMKLISSLLSVSGNQFK